MILLNSISSYYTTKSRKGARLSTFSFSPHISAFNRACPRFLDFTLSNLPSHESRKGTRLSTLSFSPHISVFNRDCPRFYDFTSIKARTAHHQPPLPYNPEIFSKFTR